MSGIRISCWSLLAVFVGRAFALLARCGWRRETRLWTRTTNLSKDHQTWASSNRAVRVWTRGVSDQCGSVDIPACADSRWKSDSHSGQVDKAEFSVHLLCVLPHVSSRFPFFPLTTLLHHILSSPLHKSDLRVEKRTLGRCC